MADALSITAAAMAADMQRVATISHNLANATTPAFRRELSYSRPVFDLLDGAGLQAPVPQVRSVTDLRAGTLRATAAALDVALEGDGWFEVMTPEGPAYTRRGDFQLDARGVLATRQGFTVMGSSGEIALGSGTVRIDTQGRVFEDQRSAGQLRVVSFPAGSPPDAAGDGLFRAAASAAVPVERPTVRQGHLENGNVQTVAEMVRLIETMRHFETSQKFVQGVDDVLGRAIRTLGEY
jgi:flagellar basal-body rod protein FlgF